MAVYKMLSEKSAKACAALSTDFEARTEDDILIRIESRDKTLNDTQAADNTRRVRYEHP